MLGVLEKVLQAQNVSQEKILYILSKLAEVTDTGSNDGLWQAFCTGCLDVGLDPQAIFALVTLSEESLHGPAEADNC